MSEDRISALEDRLRLLEDEREITRLVASYGPLVDAGRDEVADLWTADGVYDVDELFMGDREAVLAMVRSPEHQGLLARGCAHFLGPVHVTVEGDRARAVCHSVLLVAHEGRNYPVRIGANLWHLVRTDDGWRAQHRVTRALTGSEEARALLAEGVLGPDA